MWSTLKFLLAVYRERRRQLQSEGFDDDHDSRHFRGELGVAGAAYAVVNHDITRGKQLWPFLPSDFKPSPDPARNLIKAAAVLIAELERLERRGSGAA